MVSISVLLVCLGCLVLIKAPLAICMALATLLTLTFTSSLPTAAVVQKMFTGMDSFPLLAVPLFMIAGRLMELGGISKRLIELAKNIVGGVTGGLAMVAVLGCMFFAAISGSAPATVVAIGSIIVPAMVREGYDKRFSVSLMAAAGTIGVIIPPSIPFVNYGVAMNVSISKLFMAGFAPGVLMGLSLMAVCYVISKKHGYSSNFKPSLRGFTKALIDAIWAIMMPVIILGGIYGGLFTPTEAAGVSVLYSIVVGCFIYREMDAKTLFRCFYEAGALSAMVLMLISTATAMGWVLTVGQVPIKLSAAIASVSDQAWVILLLLNVALLINGCIMDPNATIIILGPILLPLLMRYGIDPLHFGVVMVVNVTIGMLTPPFGVNLFVASGLHKGVTFKDVVQGSWPFLLVLIFDLMLLTYIPNISLFLVNTFM